MTAGRTHWRWPVLAATLPARARFHVLARVAASDCVVFPEEAAAYAQAAHFGYTCLRESDTTPVDEATWRRAWRLVQLVDHADLFVALTRAHDWFDASADVRGAWPVRGPFLAVTYHWGAGLGALQNLAGTGHRAHFLSGRFGDADFGYDAWRLRYVRLRARATERASGAPIIYTGGASAQIEAAFSEGSSVVALCDVPVRPGRSAIAAPLGRLQLTIPLGLIRIACALRIPVVSFSAGLDRTTGRRHLAIQGAHTFADPQALATVLAAQLDSLLGRDGAAWHMWPYADRLLS